jgi:hypothetical protein
MVKKINKKTLFKIKNIKVKLSKEKKYPEINLKKEESKTKKPEEEQQKEEKKEGEQENEEGKFSDFKENILEEDIGFAAPVIEEEKFQNNLETLPLTQENSSLESTASGVFLPSSTSTSPNQLYSATNNLYGSGTSGTYDNSRYENGFSPLDTNNPLQRQTPIENPLANRSRGNDWGSDRQDMENFARIQEQYRVDREQEAKKRRH